MAAPTLTLVARTKIKITAHGSSMGLIITKDRSFYINGSEVQSYMLPTIDPTNVATTPVLLTGGMLTDITLISGSQYDAIRDTIVTCTRGVVNEYNPDGTKVRSASWASVLGNADYQGVLLGYEGEDYFYILSKTGALYRCNRNFEGFPVLIRSLNSNHFSANWTANGFLNDTYVYTLQYSGSTPRIARTNVANGQVSYLSLPNALTGGNFTSLRLSNYKGRVIVSYTTYNTASNPDIAMYDVSHILQLFLLIQDGDTIKSYTDTGYTRNLCVGGAVISSMGYQPGHPNTDAFDDNASTFWGSNETGQNVQNAFIGYDFEATPRHIRRIEIVKATDITNTPQEILVQYSDDGAEWTNATTPIPLTLNAETQVIDLPNSAIARRWRLRANTGLAGGKAWCVPEIRMYERNLTGWYVVGQAPATFDMFDFNGLLSIDDITAERLSYLGTRKFRILAYTEKGSENPVKMSFNAVPHPRVVYSNNDIPLASALRVNGFTLSATESGEGIVRVILSPDSGQTWYTWDMVNDVWVEVDDKNLEEVSRLGMTAATLNERVAEEWDKLIGVKVRFAYYLEQKTLIDQASTELLKMDINMMGVWQKADDSDYTYSYPQNDVVTVKLFSDGDYKINFDTNTGASAGSGGKLLVLDGGTF